MTLKELINFIQNDKIISILMIFVIVLIGTLLYYNLNVNIDDNQNQLMTELFTTESVKEICDDWNTFSDPENYNAETWYKVPRMNRFMRKEIAYDNYSIFLKNLLNDLLNGLERGYDKMREHLSEKGKTEKTEEDIVNMIEEWGCRSKTASQSVSSIIMDDNTIGIEPSKYQKIITYIKNNINGNKIGNGGVDSSVDQGMIDKTLTYIYFLIFAIEVDIKMLECEENLKSDNINKLFDIKNYIALKQIQSFISILLGDQRLMKMKIRRWTKWRDRPTIGKIFMNQASLGNKMHKPEHIPAYFWFRERYILKNLIYPGKGTIKTHIMSHVSELFAKPDYTNIKESIPDINKMDMGTWESPIDESIVYAIYIDVNGDAYEKDYMKEYQNDINQYCIETDNQSAYKTKLKNIKCPSEQKVGKRNGKKVIGQWKPFNSLNEYPYFIPEDHKMRIYKDGTRRNIFEDSYNKPVGAKFCRGGWTSKTGEGWYKNVCEEAGGVMMKMDTRKGPYMCSIGGDYLISDNGRCGPKGDYKKCPQGEWCSQYGWCGNTKKYAYSNRKNRAFDGDNPSLQTQQNNQTNDTND